jgi:anthranilate synthase component I
MTEIEFKALSAQGFNRIPLLTECLADLDTPLSLYLKLTEEGQRNYSFLLESVVGGERFGRYSFIGLPARQLIRSTGDSIQVLLDGVVIENHRGNPIDFVRGFLARFKTALRPGLPRFCGGLAGYFGYDVVRFIEPRLGMSTKPDPVGTPDMMFLQVDELAIVDNLMGKLYLMVYADPGVPDAFSRASKRLRELRARLSRPVESAAPPGSEDDPAVVRHFAKADYLDAAQQAREYIMAGDLMQVQIGQRLQKPFAHPPLSLYRALRSLNPSPYMYYYDFGDFHVVGASPEILVRQDKTPEDQERITIRPLAGTRKRGLSPQHDAALAAELLTDPKERAEHLMLIDLARNDIGRIANIVSNVEGLLRPGLDAIDVLKASFPAGTLTGAPKVRAMEIIDELEPTKRGIYGGACGYLSYSGDMDLAITIRTGIVKNKMLYVQAAAGIVYDSSPEAEWQETEAKARAVIRAAELVEQGL